MSANVNELCKLKGKVTAKAATPTARKAPKLCET